MFVCIASALICMYACVCLYVCWVCGRSFAGGRPSLAFKYLYIYIYLYMFDGQYPAQIPSIPPPLNEILTLSAGSIYFPSNKHNFNST